MLLNFFVEFKNGRVLLKLNLPLSYMDNNEDSWMEMDEKIIYQSKDMKIDPKKLYKCSKKTIDLINKNWNLNSDKLLGIKLNLSDDSPECYNFIRMNKEFDITLTINSYDTIIKELKDNEYPNLKIRFINSDEDIKYKEFYMMYLKLFGIVDFIKHYNLSPLERVVLTYDIVKANKYNQEKANDDKGISRNLNQIVQGNKIVCVGFANLIDFLLNNLNIPCKLLDLNYQDKKTGHERNYIYLKDEKYNIDGVFFLDSTWDSRKNDDYLDNYYFFLKPFNFFRIINKNEVVTRPMKLKVLDIDFDNIDNYIDSLGKNEILSVMININQLLNEYSIEKPNTFLCLDKNKLKKSFKEIYLKFNQNIPENAFKNALYKVRKIEYINKIIEKPLDEKDIDLICNRYYKNRKNIKLLKALGFYEEPTLQRNLDEAKATSTEEDLLRMRLLKALKIKINDLPENEYIKKM